MKCINTCNYKNHNDSCENDICLYLKKFNPNDKKSRLYNEWMITKLNLVRTEENLSIDYNFLPKRINPFEYDVICNHKSKQFIDNNYTPLKNSSGVVDTYKILSSEHFESNSGKKDFESSKINFVKDFVFRAGNVVWIDFGFNVGTEFGGRHPAVILKKAGENLIVIPLSSVDTNKDLDKLRPFELHIDNVYKFPKKIDRWLSVDRITSVSMKRVDFKSKFGNISTDNLNKIRNKIRNNF